MKSLKLVCTVATLALTSHLCFAQQFAFNAPPASLDDASSKAAPENKVTAVAAVVQENERPLTERWLDLTAFSHSERFRNQYNFGDAHMFEGGQERSLIQARLKLDAQDRYSIGFRASTGHYYNWAFSDFAGKSEAQRVAEGDLGKSFGGSPYFAERVAAIAADPGGKVLLSHPSTGWAFPSASSTSGPPLSKL